MQARKEGGDAKAQGWRALPPPPTSSEGAEQLVLHRPARRGAARVERLPVHLEDAGRIVGHAEGGAGVGRARQLLCGAVPPAQRQPEVAAVVAPEVNLDGAADRLAQRPLRLPVRRHPPAEPTGRAAQPHLGEGPAARRARRGVCAMRLLAPLAGALAADDEARGCADGLHDRHREERKVVVAHGVGGPAEQLRRG
eukprot:CAMPEP_0196685156 /NCGR_PEP_ID=MMETSP1090-20130531/11033_1 /TAXON_ID=37098 /ORGANISM="Isochrysis sp, Strain CCMP1244" /LENGTH=195 /DNA_ID=CAMNT_0042023669 /DNA_START=127 /DNA_END=710 /DNA_ORIENTATION=-